MTDYENSIILNRMQTVIDLYDRNNTIATISDKTGLPYMKVRKILSTNNYFHGIKMTQKNAKRPMNAIFLTSDFAFLLDYPQIDSLRM